jgi:hypothetical protein
LHDKANASKLAEKVLMNAAARAEIARKTKTGPKVNCCKSTERKEGYAHFKCEKCMLEFCWVCKVIWPKRKALHLNTCRFGTKSIVLRSTLKLAGYTAKWYQDKGYDFSLDSDSGLPLIASQQ